MTFQGEDLGFITNFSNYFLLCFFKKGGTIYANNDIAVKKDEDSIRVSDSEREPNREDKLSFRNVSFQLTKAESAKSLWVTDILRKRKGLLINRK